MAKDKFDLGNRVISEKHGAGTIIWKGSSENYGVKFDNGGPQGWADKATNDIADLSLEPLAQAA